MNTTEERLLYPRSYAGLILGTIFLILPLATIFLIGSYNLSDQKNYLGAVVTFFLGLYLLYLAVWAPFRAGKVEVSERGLKIYKHFGFLKIAWQDIKTVEILAPPPLSFKIVSTLMPAGTRTSDHRISISYIAQNNRQTIEEIGLYRGREWEEVLQLMKKNGLSTGTSIIHN